MKKKIWLPLLLCLALLVTGCSKGMVVGTVNGQRIYESEVKQMLLEYFETNGVSDPSSSSSEAFSREIVEQAISIVINEKIVDMKAKEMGLDVLSEDEKAKIEKTVDDYRASFKQYLHSSYLAKAKSEAPDGNDESWEAAAQAAMDEALASIGYDRDTLIKQNTLVVIEQKLIDRLTESLTVTDQEIQDEYDARVAEMKEEYAETPSSYEQDRLNGATVYYNPAGFREIKHILIKFTDEDAETITALQNSGDTAGAEAAKQTALANIRDKAQSVLDSLKKDGSNFDEVMKQSTEDSSTDAYIVGNLGEDTSFDKSFTEAAFALKKPGSISGLTASSFGYHILYYAGDVAEGAVPLQEVRDYTSEQLLSSKKNQAYADQLEAWQNEMNVETFPDRVDLTKYKTSTATASPSSK